jgi:transcriptional regulator GlxA family with amidase domain
MDSLCGKRNGPPEIGILLYPGVQMSAVLGLADMFFFADKLSRTRLNQTEPLLRVSQLDAGGTLKRITDTAPQYSGSPRVIILPPCFKAPSECAISDDLLAWLRAQHTAGVVLAAVCGGGFVLAQTGLLQGRSATTHYSLTTLYTDRFPDVVLDADKLVIDHGDLVTAGGLMAWTDLGLRLIERLLGRTAMAETARFLVIDVPGREQRFYQMFTPKRTHGDEAILKIQDWLSKVSPRAITTISMAKHAGLEERTFQRRFRRATGLAPTAYCQHLRINRARELLEATAQPISKIAWDVGYDDPGSFRKMFFKITGLTPNEHRKRFGVQPRDGVASTIR